MPGVVNLRVPQSVLQQGTADAQKTLTAVRWGIETRQTEMIVADVSEGKLGAETDATALSGHIMAAIQGMSPMPRDGTPRVKLFSIAESAMQTRPAERAHYSPLQAVGLDCEQST